MGPTGSTNVHDEHDLDTGRFSEKYADEEFLDAIEALGGAAGTSEVADEVGSPQRTAYHRLSELREQGAIQGRKIGGTLVWMLPENGEETDDDL